MKRMNKNDTLKVYGKIVRTWRTEDEKGFTYTTQLEVKYRVYDAEGNKIRTGTEDFSAARWGAIKWYRIFGWDGERYDAGGHRWFQQLGQASIDPSEKYKLRYLAEIWNKNQALVEVR